MHFLLEVSEKSHQTCDADQEQGLIADLKGPFRKQYKEVKVFWGEKESKFCLIHLRRCPDFANHPMGCSEFAKYYRCFTKEWNTENTSQNLLHM